MALNNRSYNDSGINPSYGVYGTQNPYPTQSKWSFTQVQNKVLTRSFFVTGLSFVAIFIISYALFEILKDFGSPTIATTLLWVSIPLIFISLIMSFFMRPKISHASMRFMIAVISLYTIAQGLGFAFLFYAVEYSNLIGYTTYNLIDIMFLFAVAGLMFIGMAFVGLHLSNRATVKLGKFLFIASIVFIICAILFSLVFAFTLYANNQSQVMILAVVNVISGLINLGYIAYLVSVIKKSTEFLSLNAETGLQIRKSLSIYFGFWLLVGLVGLLWNLIRLYLLFK